MGTQSEGARRHDEYNHGDPWTIIWISDQAFKPASEDFKSELESLGCNVKCHKTCNNAIRTLDKKSALVKTVVLLSNAEVNDFSTYLCTRPELTPTEVFVVAPSNEVCLRRNTSTCVFHAVPSLDDAIFAISALRQTCAMGESSFPLGEAKGSANGNDAALGHYVSDVTPPWRCLPGRSSCAYRTMSRGPSSSRSMPSAPSSTKGEPPSSRAGAGRHNLDTPEERTTVMLRNLPARYTRQSIEELLHEKGFRFDFLYLPIDFASSFGLGYCFVNFTSGSEVARCWQELDGYAEWTSSSDKVCKVAWAEFQGYTACIEHYRNSPVMHSSVPDLGKPAIFRASVCMPFPLPTKEIKAPKLRGKTKKEFESAPPRPSARATPEKDVGAEYSDIEEKEEEGRTTIILRGLPLDYTTDSVRALLDINGLDGYFDFLYLPMDFKKSVGLRYCFVNFISASDAAVGWDVFDGFVHWPEPNDAVCKVMWSDLQGLANNIEKYRNSPVMHESVPDRWKPMLFEGGKSVAFPAPTKAVRAPRRKKAPSTLEATGEIDPPSDSSEEERELYSRDGRTTVMLRNLPVRYTRTSVEELLAEKGFHGRFDFLYVPMDFHSSHGRGYCFINFTSPSDVARCWREFDGYSDWPSSCKKVCELSWSDTQGLTENIDRYRNSPVMHKSVPDLWRPALFEDGVPQPFPLPTRPLKAPDRKKRSAASGGDSLKAAEKDTHLTCGPSSKRRRL